MKPNIHTFSLVDFQNERTEVYRFVMEKLWPAIRGSKDIAVTAPVKSGKRLMVELCARLSQRSHGEEPSEYHFYITSLNRQDTKEQIEELESYGVIPLIIRRKNDVEKSVREIKLKKATGIRVVVHFDESDYGTEYKQLMAKVYAKVKLLGVCFLYYSATNEEVLFSDQADAGEIIPFKFTPNANYRGAEWFLENDLVVEAEPFYDENGLTKQGREACEYFVGTNKTISVLRDIGNELENNEEVKDQLFNEFGIKCKFIDGKRPFNWKSEHKDYIRDEYVKINGNFQKIRYLLVICLTCSRSTEVGFHEHIAFWHDFRGDTATYATMAQAFLRVAHYHPAGHKIRVYAGKEEFELAADRIDYNQYQGKLAERVRSVQPKIVNRYRVQIIDADKLKEVSAKEAKARLEVKHRIVANVKKNKDAGKFFSDILKALESKNGEDVWEWEGRLHRQYTVYNLSDYNDGDFVNALGDEDHLEAKNAAEDFFEVYPELDNKVIYFEELARNVGGSNPEISTKPISMYQNR